MSISASKQSLQIAKRNLSNFDENSVISIRFDILRRLNDLSTPFYTLNIVHVDFSIETSAANRKMQSFKFGRKLCYFFPDWYTTTFKRSFHSIQHAECNACRFQRRNNPRKSQMAIFQITTKTLLFWSGLRHYGVLKLFPLHSTRRTYCMPISVSKQYLKIAKRNLSNFDENSVISIRFEILRRETLFPLHSTRRTYCMSISAPKQFLQIAKRNLSNFYENSVVLIPIWDITAF
jgi:DNA-binding Xre family transcriptional regulator